MYPIPTAVSGTPVALDGTIVSIDCIVEVGMLDAVIQLGTVTSVTPIFNAVVLVASVVLSGTAACVHASASLTHCRYAFAVGTIVCVSPIVGAGTITDVVLSGMTVNVSPIVMADTGADVVPPGTTVITLLELIETAGAIEVVVLLGVVVCVTASASFTHCRYAFAVGMTVCVQEASVTESLR